MIGNYRRPGRGCERLEPGVSPHPGGAPPDGIAQPDFLIVPRPRVLRLHHAKRHRAQCPGEPRMVQAVHALSGRNRAGTSPGAAHVPDNGQRSDRHGDRERVSPRRGHCGGGGDGDAPPHPGAENRGYGGPAAVFRRRLVLPADDRVGDDTRRAAWCRGDCWQFQPRAAGRSRVRRFFFAWKGAGW